MEQSNDSRFFPGYTWVMDNPQNQNLGLCFPGSPAEAAEIFFSTRPYHRRKNAACWTMTAPGEIPVMHTPK